MLQSKVVPDKVRSDTTGSVLVKKEKFEGRTEELSGYIFDITPARNANNYSRSLKEIARHVGSTNKFGADLKRTIKNERMFVVSRPSRPTALKETPEAEETEAYDIDMDIYREDIKNYVKRRSTLLDNMGRTYEVVWGQCTQPMRAKVESSPKYDSIRDQSDLLGLINQIKLASFDFHSQKNSAQALIEVEKAFLNFRQMDNSTELYHEQFKSLSEAYASCGGFIGYNIGLIEKYLHGQGNTLHNANGAEMKSAEQYVKGEYIGCIFC